MKLQVFILAISVFGLTESTSSWDYTTNGPSTWASNFAKCGGTKQSPIDITTSAVSTNSSLGTFTHSLFSILPTGLTIKNNGHALQVDVTGGYTIDDKSLLHSPFKLAQYHIHWAANKDSTGSEHTINGVQQYGEIHFVHYNTKYADLTAAATEDDGVAVLGVLIEVSTTSTGNTDYDKMLGQLDTDLDEKDESKSITPVFAVSSLLPSDLSVYYRYEGSLTTPTCDESVTWTVFANTIKISSTQATTLSDTLYVGNSSTSKLNANFRPVQSLNNRIVYKPGAASTGSSGSTLIRSSIILASITTIVVLLF